MSVRYNILLLALLTATLIAVLAFASDGVPAPLFTLASAFVGTLGPIMLRLCEPPPNPAVPAAALTAILAGDEAEGAAPAVPWRVNVLALAMIGAGLALSVALVGVWAGLGLPNTIINVVATIVGAIGTAMARLVDPDEPAFPASVVAEVLNARTEYAKAYNPGAGSTG